MSGCRSAAPSRRPPSPSWRPPSRPRWSRKSNSFPTRRPSGSWRTPRPRRRTDPMTNEQLTLQRQELTGAQRALLEKRLQGARSAGTLRPRPADIQPRAPREHLPLSFAQERLWFLDQLYPGQAVYNIYQAVRLTGHLDRAALELSLNDLLRHHEAFRTNFAMHAGGPVQVVAPERRLEPGFADLTALAGAA